MAKEDKLHYVVVTGIIIKDSKYLIARRAAHEKAFPNKWTVPGGKLEVDDYINKPKDTHDHWYNILEDLLKREVREEVGLEINNIRYLTDLAFIRPDNIPVVVISLYTDYASGEVKLDDDHTDFAWVTLDEAESYDLIDGIYEELKMLEKILKGRQDIRWNKN